MELSLLNSVYHDGIDWTTTMTWDPNNPVVPVDHNGNMLTFATYNATMEPFPNFRAFLTMRGIYRGRSAARTTWEDNGGRHYSMFLADLEHLLKIGRVDNGRTDFYEWKAVKRGQNYGIALVDDWLDL